MRQITLCEVGPRDGFQNVGEFIPFETKLSIIDAIVGAGVKNIQVTSFVSPKAVPQMKDASKLAGACLSRYPQVCFSALAPNLHGARAAWESGIRRISYVVSLSLSHNRANINRSHEESLDELKRIRDAYPEIEISLDLATAFGCPFEGRKSPAETAAFIGPYAACGLNDVDLCDTVGMADPAQVRETIARVRAAQPGLSIQVHIHDTRNMGMVNTLAAVECGVDLVQATLGGLGGCPFAPGASGNLASEDLVFMLTQMGYELNLDPARLLDAAKYQLGVIRGGQFSGHLQNIK